jgi:hypothetical protein
MSSSTQNMIDWQTSSIGWRWLQKRIVLSKPSTPNTVGDYTSSSSCWVWWERGAGVFN